MTVMKKTKSRPWALAGGMEPDANTAIAFPGTEKEMRMSTRRVPVKQVIASPSSPPAAVATGCRTIATRR